MKIRNIIIALYWMFCLANGIAQSMIFTNLTTENGLSSNNAYTFLQDSRGFMWIGTKDGLNRYDGTSFQVYKHRRSDSTSIPDDWITSLVEDKNGNIWMGTWQGIAKMNPYTGKVIRYQHQAEKKNTITINNENYVFCDSKGSIWVSNPHGVFLFRESSQDFECKLDLKSKKEHGLRMYEDKNGNFWIASFHGVYFLNSQDFSYKKHVPLPQNPVSNVVMGIKEDKNGMIWLGMWGGGLAFLDPKTGGITVYQQPKRCKGEFIVTDIHEQIIDNQHRVLWIAKFGELMRLDLYDNQYPKDLESVILYKHEQGNPYTYLEGESHAIYADKEGIIWIGTSQGIARIVAQNQRFLYYPPCFSYGFTYLQYDSTDARTSFWAFAWYGHESCQLDTNFKVVKRWKSLPPKKNLNAGNISNFAKDKEGNIWLATFDGLAKYQTQKNDFQWLENEKNNSNSLFSNRTTGVYAINEDIWVTLYNLGIAKYSPSLQQWKHYSKEKNCLPSAQIHTLYKDKKNRIWILTDAGIARYISEIDDFEVFASHQILQSDLIDIVENEDGAFWIGGNQGMFYWNPDTDSLKIFSIEEGLDNPKVVDIEKDKQDNVWILTEKGLNLFRPNLQTFTHFGKENGFLSQNAGACITKDKNGNLYIGDFNNKICKIRPTDFAIENNILPLYIEQITINGQPLYFETPFQQNQEVFLKYNENQIQIDFTAIDFVNGNQIRYACMLENSQENWQEIGNRKFAAYVNIPPGRYVFKVKGCDAMGKWTQAQNLVFVIAPPFWKTNSFIWGAFFLFLLAFGGLVRYIFTKQLKEKILILEKEQAVEKERNRISQDMHDDIGSGLSKIVIMSEVLKRQKELNEKAQQQLQTISESAGEIIDNMQHIIWFLHSNNDNMERFLSYVREYISKYLENIGIEYQYDFPSVIQPIPISQQIRRNIFLVVKEILHNIAKYSKSDLVIIAVKIENTTFSLLITDNGVGFNPAKTRTFGNGIKNIQSRIAAINGRCEIYSEEGKGTQIEIKVELE